MHRIRTRLDTNSVDTHHPEQEDATTSSAKHWSGQASTYYNLPLVKKAPWGWQIILYFFLGGIAGGSYLIATLADLSRTRKEYALIRAGRYLSFVCILISPILLIWDLGRPERFHHMLRVFKLRSVMSLGTWAISFFGLCCGLTTVHQAAHDGLLNWFPVLARTIKVLPVRLIEPIGSFLGLFVASYTGVLLSSTAVPLWARAKHFLGPLFLTSALSTAFASLSLLLSFGHTHKETLERLEQAEIATMTAELSLISTLIAVSGSFGKPLLTGRVGKLFTLGTLNGGILLPLLLRLGHKLRRGTTSRTVNITASLLVLLGGLILRTTFIIAGRISANNPQAAHEYNMLEETNRPSSHRT